MGNEKYWDLISKYLSKEISLEETEQLLTWLGDDPVREELFRELQKSWDKTRDYPENLSIDTQVAWLRLRSSIKENIEIEQRPKRWKLLLVGLAAVMVLLAAFFLLLK